MIQLRTSRGDYLLCRDYLDWTGGWNWCSFSVLQRKGLLFETIIDKVLKVLLLTVGLSHQKGVGQRAISWVEQLRGAFQFLSAPQEGRLQVHKATVRHSDKVSKGESYCQVSQVRTFLPPLSMTSSARITEQVRREAKRLYRQDAFPQCSPIGIRTCLSAACV